MEDFRLIFYLGIAIAWFVYKNYQKVQQNRPKKVDTRTTTREKEPLEMAIEKVKQQKKSIAAKLPEFKKDFKTFKKTGESKPVLKDELKKKTTATSPFLNVDTTHHGIQTFSDSKKDSEIIKEVPEEDLFDLKKFDIRTAIIYSEILKRPQL
jgi:hypothetical protein